MFYSRVMKWYIAENSAKDMKNNAELSNCLPFSSLVFDKRIVKLGKLSRSFQLTVGEMLTLHWRNEKTNNKLQTTKYVPRVWVRVRFGSRLASGKMWVRTWHVTRLDPNVLVGMAGLLTLIGKPSLKLLQAFLLASNYLGPFNSNLPYLHRDIEIATVIVQLAGSTTPQMNRYSVWCPFVPPPPHRRTGVVQCLQEVEPQINQRTLHDRPGRQRRPEALPRFLWHAWQERRRRDSHRSRQGAAVVNQRLRTQGLLQARRDVLG